MEEEYKICFEDYEISNFGNCRRKMNNGMYKDINGSIQNRGYKYFQVQRNGKRINNFFHQMVAKCFLGEREENKVIDHIDRNKLNNNVNNLRYVTQLENMHNTDRFIASIPIETENRREKVIKLYNTLNREKILAKKKEYYNKNKEALLLKNKQKRESNKIIFCCAICNKNFEIQRDSIKYKKTNNCYTCTSIENLKLVKKNKLTVIDV